jgi:kynurenine formamidase
MQHSLAPLSVSLLLASMTVAPSAAQESVSEEQLRGWMSEIANSGRWGPEDQLGTLNLITPAHRAAAATLVQAGITVSLSHDLTPGPNENANSPFAMNYQIIPVPPATGAIEELQLPYHGFAYSHLDGLSHYALDDTLFNGHGLSVLSESGATELGIEGFRDGIVSRGVLVDVPRMRGVDHLQPDEFVTVADLIAWEQQAGVRVAEGDVLLIRTGRWHREEVEGPWSVARTSAGLHPSVALWLHERGVAALGSDGVNDRQPSVVDGLGNPLHLLAIVGMGMPLFDNLDLEDVAAVAASQSRWEFFFIAAPLRVVGGSGSPINPLAVF